MWQQLTATTRRSDGYATRLYSDHICSSQYLQAVAEGFGRDVLESNVVCRTHERKLRLEPVMLDQRHNLLRRQRALDLLAEIGRAHV